MIQQNGHGTAYRRLNPCGCIIKKSFVSLPGFLIEWIRNYYLVGRSCRIAQLRLRTDLVGTSECKEGSCTTDEVLQHSIAGDNIEFARHCNHRSTLAPLDSCFHACARMLYLMQEKKVRFGKNQYIAPKLQTWLAALE